MLLLYCSLSFSQTLDSVSIVGQLKGNSRYTKAVLIGFGVGQKPLGAAKINDETFTMKIPNTIVPGVYRFQFSQANANEYLDVIIDGIEKNIHFTIDLNKNSKLPFFSESNENKRWYDYVAQSQKKIIKIKLLNQLLNQYPDQKDKIVAQAKYSLEIEKENYTLDFDKFITSNASSLSSEMVANKPYYFANATDLPAIQDYNRRNQYWDKINTVNPKLITTPIYTEHILNYLKYYLNPEMKFGIEEMENGFKKSADTIMQKFGGNSETKKFALQYLILGFKEIGQEKVLQYIDEKYSAELKQCQNDTDKIAFEERIAGYAMMKVGMQAPDIEYSDAQGKSQKLKDIKSENVIVVFWASWCPNCSQEMPKLNELMATKTGVKVLAISLDEDEKSYMEATSKLTTMIHFSDFKKWNGKTVLDYHIVATPSFIVLDKDKKIIGKFSSLEELEKSGKV
jgi:peroxiredoxin